MEFLLQYGTFIISCRQVYGSFSIKLFVLSFIFKVIYCSLSDTREPYSLLEALVATLSTGPVGPGDKINDTDVLLTMMSCDGNGRLLKPSHPATAIDKQIIKVLHRHELKESDKPLKLYGSKAWSELELVVTHIGGCPWE